MSKQEILAPETVGHDRHGRFDGSSAGPGRKAGVPNKTTRELRAAIMQAFENVGGADYLTVMAACRPDLFMPLLAKVLPIKLTGDDEGAGTLNITRVEYVITNAPE